MTCRFTWRAEMKAVGAHFEHQAGIAHRTLSPPLPDGCDKVPPMLIQKWHASTACAWPSTTMNYVAPSIFMQGDGLLLTQVVESIVMTGGYEDDVDDGDYVVYTSKSAVYCVAHLFYSALI